MSLTRKGLKAAGLTDEQVEFVMEGHAETVDGLKKQADQFKADADAYAQTKAELEKLQQTGGDWESRYNTLQDEYNKYKSGIEGEKLLTKKRADLNSLLTEAGVQRESFREVISKGYDLNGLAYDDEGKLKDHDALLSGIKDSYPDFIAVTENKPAGGVNPPSGGGTAFTAEQIRHMSAAEINANWPEISKALGNK